MKVCIDGVIQEVEPLENEIEMLIPNKNIEKLFLN